MNERYLIPANSKKSMLILSYFTPFDIVVFSIGIIVTVAMLVVIKTNSLWTLLLMLSPALISGFLVMPVSNYHNIMTLIGNIYKFYTNRRRYYWKGWCLDNGNDKNSSKS